MNQKQNYLCANSNNIFSGCFKLLKIVLASTIIFSQTLFADADNKIFKNIRVLQNILGRTLNISEYAGFGGNVGIAGDANINGNLGVGGNTTINGTLTVSGGIVGGGNVSSVLPTNTNEVARFTDNTGKFIKGSGVLVDNFANVTLNGITKNGNTVSWPIGTGAAGTFLGSDGAGNLVYATPAGAGNVSAASNFVNTNALIKTDISSGSKNIQETTVILDNSNNISGLNSVTANSVSTNNITITGGGNITGNLIGDVTGNVTGDLTGNVTGNLTGNVTGAASLNVLKAGDSMTGNLNMQNVGINLLDSGLTNYVGIHAPSSVTSSYVVNLPGTQPTAGQVLSVSSTPSPFSTQWTTLGGGLPTNTREIYVAEFPAGNDLTGNGTFSAPYQSIAKALSDANALSTVSDPVTIIVGSGTFTENNSGGPLTITSDGITINGQSIAGTIIRPNTPGNNLFDSTSSNITFQNLGLENNPGSTGAAIVINTTGTGRIRFMSVGATSFGTGFILSKISGTTPTTIMDSVQFAGCSTAIALSNLNVVIKNAVIRGPLFGGPANTAITLNGSACNAFISDSTFTSLANGVITTNSSSGHLLSCLFENTINGVVANGQSKCQMVGCNFTLNTPTSINVQASQAGINTTKVYVDSCLFDCEDASGNAQGTCLKVTDGAEIIANNSTLDEATIGIICGQVGDTSSTQLIASGLNVRDCTNGIQQFGSSTLHFTSGTFDENLITISDPTNVIISSFDDDGNLAFGNTSDTIKVPIYKISAGLPESPTLQYIPGTYAGNGYYGNAATVLLNSNTGANAQPTASAVQADFNSASYYIVTGDNTKNASLNLLSDADSVGLGFGTEDKIRGWKISKQGSGADLLFSYTNSDPSGQLLRGQNTVMQLSGFNNTVQFPVATNSPTPTNSTAKLIWAPGADATTNLYRSATDTLTTDATLTVGTKLCVPSATLPATPTISFTGDTNTGIYSPAADNVSISTSGSQRFNIDSSGVITINNFISATGGVVHSSAAGVLSSGPVTINDIPDNSIPDSKLQTIATPGKVSNSATTATPSATNGSIVERDPITGNFATSGTITAGLFSGPLTGNVNGTVTGNLIGNASSATVFTTALSGDLSGGQNGTTSSVVTVGGQTAGNVASATILANQATDSNIANRIVQRNASGNFSAGTITANLIGSVNGNVTGDVTGNLFGNADTATQALNATGFSGTLSGDVTGGQTSTVVSSVGGKTASQVATATDLALSATSINTTDTIVKRNASGSFLTTMVSLSGTVSNPTDAATKDYVDTQVTAGGLIPHDPAYLAEITSNITLSGVQTIDGITTTTGERVLLTVQTNPIENGLWITSSSGSWYRPTDFANGTLAGKAYVLITGGNTQAGSSWICNTPTATIGTDPIYFSLFSLPGTTTGQNVGAGSGEVFRDKTGIYLNFKTLLTASPFLSITNNANDIGFSLNTDSAATPSTIVSRNASSAFSGSLTGAASLNVLKSGDTMTGNLNMGPNGGTRTQINLQDNSGTKYVGLRAPTSVTGSSYTIDLPNTPPSINQVLMATSSSAPYTTAWANSSTAPTGANPAKTYYVATYGNDTTGNGSILNPYKTVKKAIEQADLRTPANITNPVSISIAPGVYIEDNSAGGIQINSDGISIVGSSLASTIILPSQTTTDPLFISSSSNLEFYDLILRATTAGYTQSAVNLSTNSDGRVRFNNIGISGFITGLDISDSSLTPPLIIFDNIQSIDNGTAISLNNVLASIQASIFQGSSLNIQANTGISISGIRSNIALLSSALRYFDTAITINGSGSKLRASAVDIEATTNGFICQGGCQCDLVGINSILNNGNSVNIYAKNTNTKVYVEGALLNCNSTSNTATGTAIKVTDNALLEINASTINSAGIGFQCGNIGDTSSTVIASNGVNLVNCPTDIIQNGSAKLTFVGGTLESPVLNFSSPTSVQLAAFSSNGETTLSFGNTTDNIQKIYQIETGQPELPHLQYEPNYYGAKGTAYHNANTGVNSTPSFNAVQCDKSDAEIIAITGDRTKKAEIKLYSDTATTIGDGTSIRGWDICKEQTSADLKFTFTNNDTSGYLARGPNTLMQLDGFNSQVKFPTSTNPAGEIAKLVWAPETDTNTNLYRSTTDTLTTDGTLIIGSKLNVPGSTLPATPTISFTGDTNTGIYSPAADNVSISTAGTQKLNIDNSGVITVNNFISATGGVVHSSAAGVLSSGPITINDIPDDSIPDSKLQQIVTSNKVANSATTATSSSINGTIVLRDASNGNFSTLGQITATNGFVGNLSGNATSATSATTAGSATNFTGVLSGDVGGLQNSTVVSTVGGIPATGASSIASGVTAANQATDSNIAGRIVKRDASGNFLATAITANLTGAASLNVLKTGDTMSGPLAINYGSSSATTPSISFGSTGSGIYSTDGTSFSVETVGTQRLNISNSGTVTIPTLNTANGVIKNDGSGNLSSSLITNANIDPAAGIVDTKLATISTTGKVSNSATTATGANTPNTIVLRDASGNFSAGIITATTFVGNLNGIASGNISASGGTLVGTLTLAAGYATGPTGPSLQFTGSTNTGLSAQTANTLVFSTNNGQRMSISPAGTVSINSLTPAGVVHNDVSGNLTSSLIVDGDITVGTIANNKLATATTAATPGAIVVRDASGNIIGNVTGSAASFTGSLAGEVTGTQGATVVSNAVSTNTSNAIVRRDASGNFSAGTISTSGLNMSGNISMNNNNINNANSITATGLTLQPGSAASPSLNFANNLTTGLSAASTNVLSLDANGSEIVKISSTGAAFIAGSAATPSIQFTGSTNTGFSAGTANVLSLDTNGTERMQISSAGATLNTGVMTVPAGTAGTPSLQFSGSTNTGISAATANRLSFDTNGTEQMAISTGLITQFLPIAIQSPAVQLASGGGTVNVSNTTSTLILQDSAATYTINMPSAPVNGQILTIVYANTNASTNRTVNLSGTSPTAVAANNWVGAGGLGSNTYGTAGGIATGGRSVTYMYITTGAPTVPAWYRIGRG